MLIRALRDLGGAFFLVGFIPGSVLVMGDGCSSSVVGVWPKLLQEPSRLLGGRELSEEIAAEQQEVYADS